MTDDNRTISPYPGRTPGEQIIYEMKRESWEREEKAREDGKEIGKINARKRIAKSLKDLNVSPETIEKSTGLTLEQINEP